MIARMKEDGQAMGPDHRLKKGDVLEVVPYQYDSGKVTVIRRLSDDYDPECNLYRVQIEVLKT